MESEHSILSQKDEKWKILLRQFCISSMASMFALLYGLSIGAPTVIIPQLKREANVTNAVTDEMVSWISSMNSFGAALWIVVLTTMSHYIGRKKTIFFLNSCTLIGFTSLYFSSSSVHILLSQALSGAAAASITTVALMIITEYTRSEYRGIFITFKSASVFWGVWISNTLGTFFHWKSIAIFGIVCTIYNFITSIFITESPVWLAINGEYEKCSKLHRRMKGINEQAETELDKLITTQKSLRFSSTNRHTTPCRYIIDYIRDINKPEMYKPLGYCILIVALYDCSGKLVCTVYAVDILRKITSDERTAYTGMLILDGLSVFVMYFASYFVKIMKRKSLLLSSTLLCIVFLYFISAYLYLIKSSVLSENNYVTLFLLVGYSIGVCCGPVVMSTVICGEIIPIKHRDINFLLFSIVTKISIGIFLKIFPSILICFGYHGAFFTFATSTAILLFFCHKYVPETKDKTLDEIAELFKRKEDTSPENSNMAGETFELNMSK